MLFFELMGSKDFKRMNLLDLKNGVCAVIAEKSSRDLIVSCTEAFALGADLVELRLDFLEEDFSIVEILKSVAGPTLITIRRKNDGGRWEKGEETRLQILHQAQISGAHAVDLEVDCFHRFSKSDNCIRILSYHDFSKTPDFIHELHKEFESHRPELVKIACLANSNSDFAKVLELYKNANLPLVAFCMGSIGFPSRLLSLRQDGCPWMYANFSENLVNAPGIPLFKNLISTYPVKNLSNETRVYGVVGDPIGHSLSPAIHNACFKDLNYPGVYLPFHVSVSDFSQAINEFNRIPVEGLSVTIPHKERAFKIASTSSDLAKQIGAANTLVKTNVGYHAENTDATGIIAAIKTKLGDSLKSMNVLVLGAGGVSRAAVFALKNAGCNVKLTNRSEERAEMLAVDAGVQNIPWSQRGSFKSGLLVNCTSVGMHPNKDDSPWDSKWFTKGHIAFDTVYNPIETRFLREAAEAHAVTIDGVEMFVHQAAEQFNLFTSLKAPLDVMRRTVLEKLRSKNN